MARNRGKAEWLLAAQLRVGGVSASRTLPPLTRRGYYVSVLPAVGVGGGGGLVSAQGVERASPSSRATLRILDASRIGAAPHSKE